jgi:hypothetical protein
MACRFHGSVQFGASSGTMQYRLDRYHGAEIRLRGPCANDTRRYNLLHISAAADIKQLQALGTVNASRRFTLNTV